MSNDELPAEVEGRGLYVYKNQLNMFAKVGVIHLTGNNANPLHRGSNETGLTLLEIPLLDYYCIFFFFHTIQDLISLQSTSYYHESHSN